jgi:Tol biopolymer transport system component
MPEVRPSVRDVFEMVTKQVEPGVDEWREQERRQRRRNGARKAGAMALVAAVGAALIVGLVRFGGRTEQPAAPSPTPAPLGSAAPAVSLVGVDVENGNAQATGLTDIVAGQVDVAPNGNRIAFVRYDATGHPQIYLADVDGTSAQKVTGKPGQPGCACGARDPDWSADGQRIAFSGSDLRGNKDIYVLDVATETVHRLTSDFAGEAAPEWSPDGSTIAYESGDFRSCHCGTTTTGSIWTVDVATGHRTRLVARPAAASPTWSSDGAEIAFSAANGSDPGDIWLVKPDGTALKSVVALPGVQTATAWSPQAGSSAIAFDSDGSIEVVDAKSGEVSLTGAAGADPAWDPSGSTIYAWRATGS